NEGYASKKETFLKPDAAFYDRLKTLGQLTGQAAPENRFRNDLKLLNENTIYSFTISFEPDQDTFPEQKYGDDFKRALMQASLFGNAVMAVRGHADTRHLLDEFLEMAEARRVIRKNGARYTLTDGSPLDLNNTKAVIDLINKRNLTGPGDHNPKGLVVALQQLSQRRGGRGRGFLFTHPHSPP